MANEQEIDLDEAFDRVMEKYHLRDGERWVGRWIDTRLRLFSYWLFNYFTAGVERFLRAQSCLPLPE